MVSKINPSTMIRRLKKEITRLRRKEKTVRSQLRSALKKSKKIEKAYESRLIKHAKKMHERMSEVEKSLYMRLASALQKKAKNVKKSVKKKSVRVPSGRGRRKKR